MVLYSEDFIMLFCYSRQFDCECVKCYCANPVYLCISVCFNVLLGDTISLTQ